MDTLENLRAEELAIDVERADAMLRLSWRGKSNQRSPSKVLAPFFARAIEAAAAANLAIEMRFHELQHFNSSTITAVIELIQDARSKGVKLIIAYDGALKWQRLSFDALKVFSRADGLLELRGT